MKIALLCPGQGAQYPGMGKEFYENFATAREVFEEANDILGRDLSKVILEGPEVTLTETRNSQPGIYVTSYAIYQVLKEIFPEFQPTICAGLSLGEYTAATAAGYLSFQEGLPIVQSRGDYMNEACESVQGTMAVVLGLSGDVVDGMVREIGLPEDLWVANYNSPGQVVVSGTMKGIEAAMAVSKSYGAKRVLPLKVHGPFHSGLMRSAQEKLAPHINTIEFGAPVAQLVMNVTGNFVDDEAQIRDLLVKQVTHSVRWEQGVHTIEKSGVDLYIEVGPGKALTGFNKKIDIQAQTINIETLADIKQLEEVMNVRRK